MAPKNASSPSPFQIGNCAVNVEAKNFTCKSDPNSLQISINRNAKIVISAEEGRIANIGDDYTFVLVNSKDADSCSRSSIQEVLKLYERELPTMNYAANTGKQSMFLERCVSNGKYCTLLLKSKSTGGSGEVIAAITYQIIPTDMQYAEVPLAAVSSTYQHKGFGHFLYMELRKRLQNVGILTIYCWGDKESEGFWLKQGFASIAEVDRKGRARRLPIKANIRRALCFPGGSTLMVSHLKLEPSANPVDSLKFCFPLEPHKNSPSVGDTSIGPGFAMEVYNTVKSQNQICSRMESLDPVGLKRDRFSEEDASLVGFSRSQDCGKSAASEGGDCGQMTTGADLANIAANDDVKHCSCYSQGTKRRAWQASLSSLKSKKVKGSHQLDCELGSSWGSDSESDKINPRFNGCSLGISKDCSFVEPTPTDPLNCNCMENNAKESGSINMTSEALVIKELQSKGECFRIMLMNIADSIKRRHLTKVVENLGATVTPDGSVTTHVVTGKTRKTLNFCTALCSGSWIVSSSWLKESYRKGRFVDESPYILYDEDYVLKYRTELKQAVLRAKARPRALLNGYNICLAAHVQPPVETLLAIVRSAGGNIISGLDTINEPSKIIFVACEDDMEEALSAAKKGIWTFSSDWLMNCIMRQELDLDAQQFAVSL